MFEGFHPAAAGATTPNADAGEPVTVLEARVGREIAPIKAKVTGGTRDLGVDVPLSHSPALAAPP